MKKKAFTLVELLVVIAICGLLVSLLVGSYRSHKRIAKQPQLDDIHTYEINEGVVIGKVGQLQKIPILPSISGEGPPQIYIKNLPADAKLQTATKEQFGNSITEYYIVWEPKQQVKTEITIITTYPNLRDEKTVKMEAY